MIRKSTSADIKPYLSDASNYSEGSAQEVIIPENKQELIEFLGSNESAVTVAGAGTGLTASRIPLGGVIVSLEKFNELGKPESGFISAGPAVRLKELQERLHGSCWFYPPNPTENLASLGGTVATNASGSRSFKWGATRRFVEKLDIVLVDGRHATIERGMTVDRPLVMNDGSEIKFPEVSYQSPECKNASGYFVQPGMDWLDLFVGSDGTLGMFTKITFKLIPSPAEFFSAILFFETEEDSWRLVETMKSNAPSGISPCAIEYFDQNSLDRLSEKFSNIPSISKAALFVEQDVNEGQDPDALLELWAEFLDREGVDLESSWIAENEKDLKRFHDFRHQLPLIINEENHRVGRTKMGTDMAVSDSHFMEMMNYYSHALKSSEIDYVVFGHIGDNHLHINLLPEQDQRPKAESMYRSFIDQVLKWKGTVSAEHGIGKLKKAFYAQMVGPEALGDLEQIKNLFDPGKKLGRGNIF